MVWVELSSNPLTASWFEPEWIGDAWAQLEGGHLHVYRVVGRAGAPHGSLSLRTSASIVVPESDIVYSSDGFDVVSNLRQSDGNDPRSQLYEFELRYADENGAPRAVLLRAGCPLMRANWIKALKSVAESNGSVLGISSTLKTPANRQQSAERQFKFSPHPPSSALNTQSPADSNSSLTTSPEVVLGNLGAFTNAKAPLATAHSSESLYDDLGYNKTRRRSRFGRSQPLCEGVLIKSPTRSLGAAVTSPTQSGYSSATATPISTISQNSGLLGGSSSTVLSSVPSHAWSSVKSYMGAWHRRYFRLYEDGSLEYFEVALVSSVNLLSIGAYLSFDDPMRIGVCSSSGPRLESPGSNNNMNSTSSAAERFPLTIWGSDTTLPPSLPSEPIPPLSVLSRGVARWGATMKAALFPSSKCLPPPSNEQPPSTSSQQGSSMTLRNFLEVEPVPVPLAEGMDVDFDEEEEDDAVDVSGAKIVPARKSLGMALLGAPVEEVRRDWARDIALYKDWFEAESARASFLGSKVMAKGWCWKRGANRGGVLLAGWKLRYFVLVSSREICYYTAENGGIFRGSIQIAGLEETSFRLVDPAGDPPAGHAGAQALEIATPSRKWTLMPTSSKDGKALPPKQGEGSLEAWLKIVRSTARGDHMLDPDDPTAESRPSDGRSTPALGSAASSPSSQSGGRLTSQLFTGPVLASMNSSTRLPTIQRTLWQRLTGNVPLEALAPSPANAKMRMARANSGSLHGLPPGTPIVEPIDSSGLASAATTMPASGLGHQATVPSGEDSVPATPEAEDEEAASTQPRDFDEETASEDDFGSEASDDKGNEDDSDEDNEEAFDLDLTGDVAEGSGDEEQDDDDDAEEEEEEEEEEERQEVAEVAARDVVMELVDRLVAAELSEEAEELPVKAAEELAPNEEVIKLDEREMVCGSSAEP